MLPFLEVFWNNALWFSLAIFVALIFLPRTRGTHLFFIPAWILFSVHWFNQPTKYLAENDTFNAVLTIAVGIFCLYFAFLIYRDRIKREQKTLISISKAVAFGGIFYFPFHDIPFLKRLIIEIVTDQTVFLTRLLGYEAVETSFNIISLNGQLVEIILTCTAIESIALFFGVITSVDAALGKKIKAYLASIPVIYILNLFRNTFVIVAYGYSWYGDDPASSFIIAHHGIAKIGSLIALLIIAYAVFKILPEVLDLINTFINILKKSVRK